MTRTARRIAVFALIGLAISYAVAWVIIFLQPRTYYPLAWSGSLLVGEAVPYAEGPFVGSMLNQISRISVDPRTFSRLGQEGAALYLRPLDEDRSLPDDWVERIRLRLQHVGPGESAVIERLGLTVIDDNADVGCVWLRTGWPCRCVRARYEWRDWTGQDGEILATTGIPIDDIGHYMWIFDDPPRLLAYRPVWLGLLANTLLYGGIVALAWYTPRTVRQWVRRRRGQCTRCGYQLRGGAFRDRSICPECGASFHATSLD